MEASHKEDLKPCRICVDFYGSAATNYLCSKCMREEKLKAQATESAVNAAEVAS